MRKLAVGATLAATLVGAALVQETIENRVADLETRVANLEAAVAEVPRVVVDESRTIMRFEGRSGSVTAPFELPPGEYELTVSGTGEVGGSYQLTVYGAGNLTGSGGEESADEVVAIDQAVRENGALLAAGTFTVELEGDVFFSVASDDETLYWQLVLASAP